MHGGADWGGQAKEGFRKAHFTGTFLSFRRTKWGLGYLAACQHFSGTGRCKTW